jgi:hypothetical protein
MLARLNAIKGDKNDAKSSLGHMHSAHAVYLSTMLLAAGVDMMRERERERERERCRGGLPGQRVYASHVRCSSSVQIRPMQRSGKDFFCPFSSAAYLCRLIALEQ